MGFGKAVVTVLGSPLRKSMKNKWYSQYITKTEFFQSDMLTTASGFCIDISVSSLLTCNIDIWFNLFIFTGRSTKKYTIRLWKKVREKHVKEKMIRQSSNTSHYHLNSCPATHPLVDPRLHYWKENLHLAQNFLIRIAVSISTLVNQMIQGKKNQWKPELVGFHSKFSDQVSIGAEFSWTLKSKQAKQVDPLV